MRIILNFFGGAGGEITTFSEDPNAIAQRHDHVHIMFNDQEAQAFLVPAHDVLADLIDQRGIDAGGRAGFRSVWRRWRAAASCR